MDVVTVLESYVDKRGNQIIYSGEPRWQGVRITFSGSNNLLTVAPDADIVELGVDFAADGSHVEILSTSEPRTGLRFGMRIGSHSAVRIGENVGSQGRTMITAIEGAEVVIGDDCMLAMGIEIRTDDAHPIYDVRTGERLNMAQSIHIGNHVWIAKHATIMGGVTVGDGAVLGFRSIVTGDIPNNAIAAGAPARVVRRDIAWERPMVTTRRADEVLPYPGEKHERFWNLTEDLDADATPTQDLVSRPVPLTAEALAAAFAALPSQTDRPFVPQRATLARRLRWAGRKLLDRIEGH